MSTTREFLNYVLLVILAITSWWLAEVFFPKEVTVATLTRGQVDYYTKDIHRIVMDERGNPKEELRAVTLTHYVKDDHTELENSELTLLSEQGPPWVIKADTAMLPGKGDDVFLYGNVLITRGPDQSGKTVRIETSNARVQPERKYAETDDFVSVSSPPDTLTGVGAQVYFADDLSFTVLANVRRKHDIQAH